MKILVFFSVLLLFSSCSDFSKPKQLERAEKVRSKLTLIHKELNGFEKVSTDLLEVNNRLISELSGFEDDTISVETATKLNSFIRLHETIPVALDQKKLLVIEIKKMQSDIIKLKQDISEGNGRRDQYGTFLSKEERKLAEIAAQSEKCIAMLSNIDANWEDTVDEMEILIAEQKNETVVH